MGAGELGSAFGKHYRSDRDIGAPQLLDQRVAGGSLLDQPPVDATVPSVACRAHPFLIRTHRLFSQVAEIHPAAPGIQKNATPALQSSLILVPEDSPGRSRGVVVLFAFL